MRGRHILSQLNCRAGSFMAGACSDATLMTHGRFGAPQPNPQTSQQANSPQPTGGGHYWAAENVPPEIEGRRIRQSRAVLRPPQLTCFEM